MENLFKKGAIFVHGRVLRIMGLVMHNYDVCDIILRTRTVESQGSRMYFSAIRV